MTKRKRMTGAATLPLALLLSACPSNDGGGDPIDPNVGDVEITTASLANGTQCEVYSEGVNASGGNGEYSWDVVAGELPPGIDLSVEDLTDDDVILTGIPEEPGTYDFTLRVETTEGERFSREFTMVVMPATRVVIQEANLAPALAGASYFTRLVSCPDAATSWSLVGGSLPAGLSLSASGTIEGNPTGSDTASFTVRATSGGLQAQESFTIHVVANRTTTFDITPLLVVEVSAELQSALEAALARWEEIITADVPQAAIPGRPPEQPFFQEGQCGGFGVLVNGTSAEDLIVLVNITSIDGPGRVLGQAGPCVIRSPSILPFVGVLTLDADDLGQLPFQDRVDLITHEVGHVLGFGSLWEHDAVDLVTSSTSDPRFTGPLANAEWHALGGSGGVPVENEGGEGTARSHWREQVFRRELMTGFASPPNTGTQPISRVTIASLADFGYTVNLAAADPFVLTAPPRTPAEAEVARAEVLGWDEILDEPVRAIDPAGRVTTYRREPR